MKRSHEQLLNNALEEDYDFRAYELNDLDEYSEVYLLDNIPVFAHFHYPKGSLREPGHQIEVMHGPAVVNVLNDKNRLLEFIKGVAEGKVHTAEEAKFVLTSLSNESV